MSVVLGMRSISTTSSVTVHSLPFFASPVTASIGRAMSSCACSSALTTTSRAEPVPFRPRPLERPPRGERPPRDPLLEDEEPDERLPVPFAFESATLDHLVVVEFMPGEGRLRLRRGPLPRDGQALEQLALPVLLLLLGDQPVLPLELELHQLPLDVLLVVELPVGFLGDLLGHPRSSAHGRQRKEDQFLEQAHGHASTESSTKLWGGSGPVYRKRIVPSRSAAICSSASSRSPSRFRSTRNEALTTIRSCIGSPTSTPRAFAASRSTIWCSSAERRAASAAATSSPRRMRSK